MAKVTARAAFDMSALNFGNLLYGSSYSGTSTLYEVKYPGGYRDVFKGSGFKYDGAGTPISGVATSFAEYNGTSLIFIVEGARISASALVSVAKTTSTRDDFNLIAGALSGNDIVQGSKAADFLFAAGGKDTIDGGAGNDVILSGPGNDKLYGGAGADIFVFTDIIHSTPKESDQDTIYDFSRQDKIDLSLIDANSRLRGDQSFEFIGRDKFSGAAGELRCEKKASDTYIHADVNGDKKADFTIHLDDAISLKEAYFFV